MIDCVDSVCVFMSIVLTVLIMLIVFDVVTESEAEVASALPHADSAGVVGV